MAGRKTRLYYTGWRSPSRAVVLLYHRVADLDFDPQLMAVTPRHFSEQMQILSERFAPLSLSELLARSRDGTLPGRAVGVSFDDGYADNLQNARPVLERFDVPATFFLATSYLDGRREFWWDEIERVVLAADRNTNPDWHVERRENPTERHRLYRELCGDCRTLDAQARENRLRAVSTGEDSDRRPSHRPLDASELRLLIEPGMFDAGAHTATHPALSALPPAAQENEILASKRALEEVLETSIDAFAYPFGCRSHYDRTTIDAVRGAGFKSAFTAQPGFLSSTSDAFQLPRVLIRDWDGDEFAARLETWF